NIPIFHIGGGDVTEGMSDEQTRHAITKIAHVHFPSNKISASRIIQMGEEPWRVFNVGLPSLDTLRDKQFIPKGAFCSKFGIGPSGKIFLVTFHPTTLELDKTEYYVDNLVKALSSYDAGMIITYPNSDPGSRIIIERLKKFADEKANVKFIKNLGIDMYFTAMRHADAVIGNSSSGIVESGIFKVPVVDIGNRQKNRLRDKNVIDTGYSAAEITEGIEKALSDKFRRSIKNMKSVYGSGGSSKRIVDVIAGIKLDAKLITKKFIFVRTRP
ncbi:MAG: UDP-N-acetylglucosamine 2-epimerase (hydrolyzing), partial [Nitrospirae bacterium]|nr:UDP-N-acetylglucosamine 2-epimerase (hydrolyzing) [Nitrospirota bacterium]